MRGVTYSPSADTEFRISADTLSAPELDLKSFRRGQVVVAKLSGGETFQAFARYGVRDNEGGTLYEIPTDANVGDSSEWTQLTAAGQTTPGGVTWSADDGMVTELLFVFSGSCSPTFIVGVEDKRDDAV